MIYKIEPPEVNNEFAKGFGLKNLDDLKKHLESNIKREKEMKENERYELELIEQLIDKSKFEELPDSLVEDEIHKMIHELEDNVVRQGMKFEDYLSNIKKTEADLHLDFSADAIKRVKTGLAIRALAEKEKITSEEKEIDEETERSLASYKFHPQYEGKLAELEQNMRSENGKRYFSNLIRNRKAMEFLKSKVGGK
jgi:trigger factor